MVKLEKGEISSNGSLPGPIFSEPSPRPPLPPPGELVGVTHYPEPLYLLRFPAVQSPGDEAPSEREQGRDTLRQMLKHAPAAVPHGTALPVADEPVHSVHEILFLVGEVDELPLGATHLCTSSSERSRFGC